MKRALALLLLCWLAPSASGGTSNGVLNFSNTPLLQPLGDTEPDITIGADGTIVVAVLSWSGLINGASGSTNLWKGPFGQTPVFQGAVDASIANEVAGGQEADVDLGSTGTLHVTSIVAFFNQITRVNYYGVAAIACPNADTSNNFAQCKAQIIDKSISSIYSAGVWITSDGPHVYISYQKGGGGLIQVQRSDDDGFTWDAVGDPIVGNGGVTANSSFNNEQGKIVADPKTHNVYAVFVSGVAGLQKAKNANHNNIYVSRSTDMGLTWTPNLVFSAPVNVALNNRFPSLAVDTTSGSLYAAWSDAQHVFLSTSTDQGSTWSQPLAVNVAPADTAVFPWLAAYDGRVDLVYYGTTSSSASDTSAVWNVYMAQTSDGGATFVQTLVTSHPNHVGGICTPFGAPCPSFGVDVTRDLYRYFQVAIDSRTGLAAIAYTDDTLTTTSTGSPLPQIALAQQMP